MRRGGIEIDPEFSDQRAYEHVTKLMSLKSRPTAIIATNNLMALGAFQAISDLGFDCPKDVSLTGVDDSPWANVIRPRITSVVQPVEELAQVAAKWVL